jgi:hypothetical protein
MGNGVEVRRRITESLERCKFYAERNPDRKSRGQGLKRAQQAARARLATLQPSGNERAEQKAQQIRHTQSFAKSVPLEEADAIPDSPRVKVVGEVRGSRIRVVRGERTRMIRPKATVIEDERTGTQRFLAGDQPRNLSLDQLKRVDQRHFPSARAALASHASQLRNRSDPPGT